MAAKRYTGPMKRLRKSELGPVVATGEAGLRSSTQVLTRGFDPTLSVGSARPAVFRSSTYVFSSPEAAERAFDLVAGRAQPEKGERPDLIYARFNHPNAEILEDQLVPLEAGAAAAVVFNSGMAATMTAILAYARPGQSILFSEPVYGGTQHFIEDVLQPWGIGGISLPAGDTAAIDAIVAATPEPAVIWIETPANPTVRMTDLRAVVRAAAAHPRRPKVMVDNTLMGPVFQHPLQLGADVCVYSGTKYLSGFSDLLAGVVLTADPELMRPIRGRRGLFGNILQPDECWMLDGRLPTVVLRMTRASKNAQHIAERLAEHPAIERVHYPTLFTDPGQRRIYADQCDHPGAMMSIELKGGKAAAFDFLRSVRIARNAVSLGGVETLACHPLTTTHSGFTEGKLREAGVTAGMVRLSIGVEDWRDLLADFVRALDQAARGGQARSRRQAENPSPIRL